MVRDALVPGLVEEFLAGYRRLDLAIFGPNVFSTRTDEALTRTRAISRLLRDGDSERLTGRVPVR